MIGNYFIEDENLSIISGTIVQNTFICVFEKKSDGSELSYDYLVSMLTKSVLSDNCFDKIFNLVIVNLF